MNKAEQIKELLLKLDPEMPIVIEDRPDGSTWLIGPYPSFIIMTNTPIQPGIDAKQNGYIVSVNADAPRILYFLQKVFEEHSDLIHFGPYCEDEDNMTIVGGPDAYVMREEVILRTAASIFAQRKAKEKPQLIVPEQKIIVTGNHQ